METLFDLAVLLGLWLWVATQAYVLVFVAYALAPACVYGLCRRQLRRRAQLTAAPGRPRTNFVLLIPAHNEEAALPALLASISRQVYPASRWRTVLVADNCHDGTAALARQAGALCLERRSAGPSSKAQALAYAARMLQRQPPRPDTVVCILDADCWLHPHFLRELNQHFARPGAAPVVQCARQVGNAFESDVTLLDAAAEALRTQVGAASRQLLGLDSFIFGLGCCLRFTEFARLLGQPTATLAEDKEWKAWLLARRVRVAYCPAARLHYQAVSGQAGFQRQRRRWLAGQWAAARVHGLPQLVQGLGRANWSQLDFAGDLLQPPRSVLLAATLLFGTVALAAGGHGSLLSGWGWLGLGAALLAYGWLGLHLIGASGRHLRAVLTGGLLAVGIIKTTVQLPLGRRIRHWEATRERVAEL